MLSLITDLGDSALLLPASLIVLVYLWSAGYRRAALAWAAGLAGCVALTAVFKVAFLACGAEAPTLEIRSPSGHTAMSTAFYGGCAVLLAAGRPIASRAVAWIVAAVLISAIAVSRVLLHAHTAPEVAAGLLIGSSSLGLVAAGCFGLPAIGHRWKGIAAAVALLAVMTHGRHLNAEELLARIAQHLRQSTSACDTAAAAGTLRHPV
jgi:membrane-associated phospholipid phosphatase